MDRLPASDYIEKLILLEKAVGHKTGYTMLEPFDVDPGDSISIQNAARTIATFIGLSDLTFVVSRTKQPTGVGGHVDLVDSEKDVFIDIAPDVAESDSAVLATLSHEISHKYLHINRITWGSSVLDAYHNEVLTDVTAVFLRLGKLMLNGCVSSIMVRPHGDERMRSQQLKVGYLNPGQLAFTYKLVCAMRSTPKLEYERHLSPEALASLSASEASYRSLFDLSYLGVNGIDDVVARMHMSISQVQEALASIEKCVTYIQRACLDASREYSTSVHRQIFELVRNTRKDAATRSYDPCLNYLAAAQLNNNLSLRTGQLSATYKEVAGYRSSIGKVTRVVLGLRGPFLDPSPEMFSGTNCPNDGTKVVLSPDCEHQLAQCPTCNYQWTASSAVSMDLQEQAQFVDFEQPVGNVDSSGSGDRTHWLKPSSWLKHHR